MKFTSIHVVALIALNSQLVFGSTTSSSSINSYGTSSSTVSRQNESVYVSVSSSDDSDDSNILTETEEEEEEEIPEDDDNIDDTALDEEVSYDGNDQESEDDENDLKQGNDSSILHENDSIPEYQTDDGDSTDGGSQPLKTLRKLQAMLEETDYATATSSSSSTPSSVKQQAQTSYTSPSQSMYRSDQLGAAEPLVARPFDPEIIDEHQHLEANQHVQDDYHYHQQNTQQVEGTTQSVQQQPPVQMQPQYTKQDSEDENEVEQLWTSKDRSKYKKQRKLQRQRELQRQRQEYLEQQIHSDDESHATDATTDGTEDTDDGLGYTLPNLPIYLSDAESTDSDDIDNEIGLTNEKPQESGPSPNKSSSSLLGSSNSGHAPDNNLLHQPPKGQSASRIMQQYEPNPQRRYPVQQGQGPPYSYYNTPNQYPPGQVQQMPQGPYQQYPQYGPTYPGQYNYPYPPPYFNPNAYGPMTTQQQQYMQHVMQQQQYQGYSMPYSPQNYYPNYNRSGSQSQNSSPPSVTSDLLQKAFVPQSNLPPTPQRTIDDNNNIDTLNTSTLTQTDQVQTIPSPQTVMESKPHITFDSIQKMSFWMLGICVMSYCAVSPRTLAKVEYNKIFKQNVQLVLLSFAVPFVSCLLTLDMKQNDVNSLISTFYASLTLGYTAAFLLEVVVTTIIRLAVFYIWEPSIFALTPDVPLIILPWTLREQNYRPKRITLFAADFAATCVAAPIIEEYMKMKIVQISTRLPRNFVSKTIVKQESSSKKKRSKKRNKVVLEEIQLPSDQTPVTNINSYFSHMLVASLGLKVCDTTRRILMYTKGGHEHKSFYAFFRGFYPVQELCGAMTALEMAKKDVLGLNTSTWRMILPAVIIHGLANLKGMKPFFKWNSAAPWSEIQMSPWYIDIEGMSLSQSMSKLLPKLTWYIILARVIGYVMKNYFMIGRKAVKRTTTFAGKNSAFTAELETSELLKRAKKEK